MNDVKWYKKLTHSDESKALLDYDTFESKTLIVMQEVSHMYAKFRTFRQFSHFFKNVTSDYKCFHEVIPGFLPQKPHFDIDVKDVSQFDNVNKAIELLIINIKQLLPEVRDRDILIFNSNGEDKISYHIIIDRWCFLDFRHNKAFTDKVVKLLPENYQQFFDVNIHTSLHNLRMFNNHKVASNRVKILDKKSTWIYDIKDNYTEFETFMNILGASLISNASYCNLLAPQYIPNNKKYDITDISLSDEEIDIILEKCQIYEKTDILPYKVDHVKGLLIELKRTAPSFCKVCKSVHENQNPFITVSLNTGDIKLYCRRSVNNEGSYVGNIISTINNMGNVNLPINNTHNRDNLALMGVFIEDENLFSEEILYEAVKSSSNPSSKKENVNYEDFAQTIYNSNNMDLPSLAEDKVKKSSKKAKKQIIVDSEYENVVFGHKSKKKNIDISSLLNII